MIERIKFVNENIPIHVEKMRRLTEAFGEIIENEMGKDYEFALLVCDPTSDQFASYGTMDDMDIKRITYHIFRNRREF